MTRSTGGTGGARHLAAENAVHLAAVEDFWPGGIGNSSVVVGVCLAIECMGYSAGGTKHL